MFSIRPVSEPAFGSVVLLASLGGMRAVSTVLAGIPVDFPVPIAVVLHRRRTPDGQDPLAAILAGGTPLPVRVARAGAAADQLGVTVVPAQTTATVDRFRRWVLADSTPGIGPGDALLAGSIRATPTIAVILTGSLSDGAEGCRAVRRGGGRVLVQDPATAQASGMPAHAIATGCADAVVPLEGIASALLALTGAPGTAAPPPWARLSS